METYLKLYTRFLDWELYKDIPAKTLFLHCLFKANYKEKSCFGQRIKRGQFITSIAHLASETGLTIQQTRTALIKLKKCKNITCKSTNQNTLITVLNWNKYHTEQQTSNKRATTTNNSTMGTTNSKPSYMNNTHTNSVGVELTKEEKEVLVRYAQKSGARNPQAYIQSLIRNGGYKEILETANKVKQRREENQPQKLEITEEERIAADKTREEITKRLKETGSFI